MSNPLATKATSVFIYNTELVYLDEDNIFSALQNDFAPNQAAIFTVTGIGDFLAINDANDGFQKETDAIIQVTSLTGISTTNFV